MKRRQFLQAGLTAAGGCLLSGLTFAHAGNGRARFIFVLLRGALDGLAAVPPYGDPAYAGLRGDLALKAPGLPQGALPLDATFGLHPSLSFLHESFEARELVVFHATATAYRERSHFDGQDVLESGLTQPHASQTGWLNRALAALPRGLAGRNAGVALGANIPLVMRGPCEVSSWSPSKLAGVDQETLTRISDLYTHDPVLAARLAEGLAADALVKGSEAGDQGADAVMRPQASPEPATGAPPGMRAGNAAEGGTPAPERRAYEEVVRATARFLASEDGPQVAVFDTTGWDTHAGEGGAQGQLAGRLRALDGALALLKTQLGPVWADTAVLLATEFGRTAAVNGTRGTDHGTAAAAFLVGGAVHGGRVMADWPGLSAGALLQGRDVRPTQDLRAVLKGVLHEHLQVPERALSAAVFPGSERVPAMRGLVRA